MASFKIDNQPTNLRMSDFYAYSSSYKSLAKSSRFAVRIVPSGNSSVLRRLGYTSFMREFTYLCESAEFPGRGFMNADVKGYHGPDFKVPYQTEYQETAMTFLCRAESFERQFFDDWMEIINPTNTFDFAYKDDYVCEIEMFQFSEGGRRTVTEPNREDSFPSPTSNEFTEPVATYAWTFQDAYPILVNPQPVTWADDNFQRLAVNFTFTKWIRKNRDPKSGSHSLVDTADIIRRGPGGPGGGPFEINIPGGDLPTG